MKLFLILFFILIGLCSAVTYCCSKYYELDGEGLCGVFITMLLSGLLVIALIAGLCYSTAISNINNFAINEEPYDIVECSYAHYFRQTGKIEVETKYGDTFSIVVTDNRFVKVVDSENGKNYIEFYDTEWKSPIKQFLYGKTTPEVYKIYLTGD